MKTVKLLLISLFVLLSASTAWAGIKINEKNFPDTNFRTWLLSQEYGKDGVLTDKEIANVEEIIVDSLKIENLKGIEYFSALKKLDCRFNELTTLDVSKNTALEILSCGRNRMTALNVSGCTALRVLFCQRNQITALDVSGCTALKEVCCLDNKLTTLDVSKNTKLEYLYCSHNLLNTLDVSKNTKLWGLNCEFNRMSSLNVSGCTALKDLDCSENLLEKLDVSGKTALHTLKCWNNKLWDLNVSGCTALKSLRCDKNQFSSDKWDVLLERLPTVDYGSLYVYHALGALELNDEMTTAQVEAAKAKGWKTFCTGGWKECAGQEDHTPATILECNDTVELE